MPSPVADASAGCLLEVRRVSKSFPGVVAVDDVSLRVERGTVHALIGENGAGKSTLMKIIAGIIPADAGELCLLGRTLKLRGPRQALESGIAMIHQELNLMPTMTVAENIWIGREPAGALGLVSHRELHRRTRALLERLRIDLDPQAEVRTLSIASRQLVEIARALSYDSQLLIMDEPTSALTERDAARLFAIIRELRSHGKGVLYITHRLDELSEIADEVTVLRDGRHIGTERAASLTREELIRMMVGRGRPGGSRPHAAATLSRRQLRAARGRDPRDRRSRWRWPQQARRGAVRSFACGRRPDTDSGHASRDRLPARRSVVRHGFRHRGSQGNRLSPHPQRARQSRDRGAQP